MRRVEIIANRSVEEDVMEALAAARAAEHHTLFPIVHGAGRQGRRTGETVWPEENFCLVVYCEEEEERRIREAVAAVKLRFPHEGIKVFAAG
ncbi:MAG TPA: hypothetical protein VMC79_16390 [Rectinemataceae bacterium]|nr:hypothetical protein [Rectinemataceae bacterium]